MIQLDAPVRSLKMLDLQVGSGATEVYVGLPAPGLNVLTFNSLATSRDEEPTQVNSIELLADIVAEAHRQNVVVHFLADTQFLPAVLREAYLNQVHRAIEVGVDSLVLGHLGLLRWIRSCGIATPVVANGFMAVTSVAYATYLRDAFGVRRIVTPHAMKLDELAALCAIPDLDVEVPVQTGAGNTCGRCMMFDSPVMPEIALGCRSGYDVRTPDGIELTGFPFLDGATDCALRNVSDLTRVGVAALQIPGRESPNLRINAKITQLYRKAIDDVTRGNHIETTIAEIDEVELLWQMSWVPRFCDRQRCRFLPTATTQSYV